MPQAAVTCYHCGTTIQFDPPLARSAVCEKCSSYLHCCRNCRFYDPLAPNECREPQAELVRDKEMANFCDFFEPASAEAARPPEDRAAEARRKLEELFGKKKQA